MKTTARRQALATTVEADPRWASILKRDPAADGRFWYSVCSTGVYCRPSCASRTARPENIAFHDSCEAAEAAGFRPCKRCRPDQSSRNAQHAALVTDACRYIGQAQRLPTLDELAARAGLSSFHFHRLFKRITGLTPRAWAAAQRDERLRAQLDSAGTVTDAIFESGFNASSRFYENADRALGMTPSTWREGGADTEIRFAVGACSLGAILVAQSGRGVCAILLGDDPEALVRDLQDRFPRATLLGGDAGFEQVVASVVGIVEAPGLGLDLPLDLRGTAFQQRVWQALAQIPPGQTVSYTELARRIGAPAAVRAVASACGANPLAVAIPCHRVVRSDGALSGYRWGVTRKQALLELEAQSVSAAPAVSLGRKNEPGPV